MKDIKNKILAMQKEIFQENSLLCGFRGSVAHNTYIPNTDPNSTDDIDLISVYLAPPEHYIGLGRLLDHRHGKQTNVDQFDCIAYELRHFVNLLLKSNPTTLLLLWLNENHYIVKTKFGQQLIDNRDLFSSKLLYKSFTRYAEDQINNMQPNTYKGYMGEKRKALVDKFGYDCKNAAHSIRLLTMAAEFLETGTLKVFRVNDAETFVQIKTGGWPIEDVRQKASKELERVDYALKHSNLPNEPNKHMVERMLMNIFESYLCGDNHAQKYSQNN